MENIKNVKPKRFMKIFAGFPAAASSPDGKASAENTKRNDDLMHCQRGEGEVDTGVEGEGEG